MSCLPKVLLVLARILPTTGELHVTIDRVASQPYVNECKTKYSFEHCPRLVIRTIDDKYNVNHTYLVCQKERGK